MSVTHGSNTVGRFSAELVRIHTSAVDIVLRFDGKMHLLQWRRYMFWDTVLVDGRAQHKSVGLWGRETAFGLVFRSGTDDESAERMLFCVDPSEDWTSLSGRASGVRLETSEGPLIANGTLDSRRHERPRTWNEWTRRLFGLAD